LSLVCREVGAEDARERLVPFLQTHFQGWRATEKFEWLYLENPLGHARVWVLEDAAGRLVGASSAFPRRVGLGDRRWDAWVLGDFAVAPEHRAIGPAVALQRAACECVDRGEPFLWYDFPSRSMMAVQRRLGIEPCGEMMRLVYLVRADRIVERKLPGGLVGRSAVMAGNSVLGIRSALRKRDDSTTVSPFEKDFDVSPPPGLEAGGGVSLERSAAYLNWRYRRDPRGRARILEARRGASHGGFLAFLSGGGEFEIIDVFGVAGDAFFRELVLEVVNLARSEGASTVTAVVSNLHPLMARFEKLGFSCRDGVPFAVYANPAADEVRAPWFLMGGDRDQ
jgi:GNAT superfamily N-acetyltransferase